ncbi:MAG TPA: hypothetical protein VK889_08530 [Solirubrobacterales bacterium]|nr:hypothetical protein [Solirubrobacterales bacterium]
MSGRELAIAWLGLAVLCALAFAPNVMHGGFYLDDWSNGATSIQPKGGPGLGNTLSIFADEGIYRPLLVLWVPVTFGLFGLDTGLHQALAASLALVVAGLLYGILRTLGVPRLHAWIVAGLTLVYPWYDSTRLWSTADQVTLGIALAAAGLWIALVGLSRRSWRWHAVAAVLYLMAILTYEVALPLIAVLGALYTVRAGWRAARVRWAVDLAMVAIGGLWVGTQTQRTKAGPGGSLDHLAEIVERGAEIAGRSVVPVGPTRTTLGVCALLGTIVLAAALYAWLPTRFAERERSWGLRGWLLLAGGGLLVTVLGWVIYIPADPYYTPSIYGITNRVNGLAGIGLVVAAYGALGIVGALLGQLLPRVRALPVIVTLVLAAVLGATYAQVLRRHAHIWHTAYAAERAGLARIKAEFPDFPRGTTLFVSGYPANQTLGVPIFSSDWDVWGMIKLEYEDWTLDAFPVIYGTRLACLPDGIRLQGKGLREGTKELVPYGKAQLFDFVTGSQARPRNPRECRAVVGTYVPGPLYLSSEY